MGYSKIHGNLTSRVGSRVTYGAPKDVRSRGGPAVYGTVVEEVWAAPGINVKAPEKGRHAHNWGDYSFCAQRIRWDKGEYSIRLAYYRRRTGEDWWEYASQMTVSSDWRTIKTLLECTLAQTSWFSDAGSAGS